MNELRFAAIPCIGGLEFHFKKAAGGSRATRLSFLLSIAIGKPEDSRPKKSAIEGSEMRMSSAAALSRSFAPLESNNVRANIIRRALK
jgi:hypothetical protein